MTCKQEVDSVEEGFLIKFKDGSQIFVRERLLKHNLETDRIDSGNHYSTEEKEGSTK